MTDAPRIPQSLKYVLIPADRDAPLQECTLRGSTDEELKHEIEEYFRRFGITSGQEDQMRTEMLTKMKSKANPNENGASTAEAEAALLNVCISERLSKFEIVPIIMPTAKNMFVARSLYIDEIGRFKELPLNERASKIAQRDIRGDCFMLSNKDDPTSESWERLHTTLEEVNEMIRIPPEFTPDPMGLMGQKAALESQKQSELLIPLSPESIVDAVAKKNAANHLFSEKKYTEAIEQYSSVLKSVQGKPDNLSESQFKALRSLKASLLTNRALAYFQNGQFRNAIGDCEQALTENPTKKLFTIMIRSCNKLRNFSLSIQLCDTALQEYPDDNILQNLRKAALSESKLDENREKSLFRGMFRK